MTIELFDPTSAIARRGPAAVRRLTASSHPIRVTRRHADGPQAAGVNEIAASARYRIRVRGVLSQTMLGAFPGLTAQNDGGDTVLEGTLLDQAALFGVVGQIEALGLELLEIRHFTQPV